MPSSVSIDEGMRHDMYIYHRSVNLGSQVVNICHNILRGEHTISIVNKAFTPNSQGSHLGSAMHYDALGRGTTALIEVEEIGVFLPFNVVASKMPASFIHGIVSFGLPGSEEYVKSFKAEYLDVSGTWQEVDNGRIFTRSQSEPLPTVKQAVDGGVEVIPARNYFVSPVTALKTKK